MPHAIVLVPTDLERRVIAPLLGRALGPARADGVRVELCGFGPVAAAARTAGLVAQHAPARVVLVGIAGGLVDSLAIGAACRFTAVASHGIGAGSGAEFQAAGALGWPQWPGDPAGTQPVVGDVILLEPAPGVVAAADAAIPKAGLLLTACAASATPQDATLRRLAFPAAVAEDMEGFGVALACRLASVPLEIVRGISNTAGNRDKARWVIERALTAAAEMAATILASTSREAAR